MIRTRIVELSGFPAVAFRRKLRAGVVSLVVQPYDGGQPGLAALYVGGSVILSLAAIMAGLGVARALS